MSLNGLWSQNLLLILIFVSKTLPTRILQNKSITHTHLLTLSTSVYSACTLSSCYYVFCSGYKKIPTTVLYLFIIRPPSSGKMELEDEKEEAKGMEEDILLVPLAPDASLPEEQQSASTDVSATPVFQWLDEVRLINVVKCSYLL